MPGRPIAVATAVVAAAVAVGVLGRPAPAAKSLANAFDLAQCGTERWAVKTFTDKAATKVNFETVKLRGVTSLRRLHVPAGLKASSTRRRGAERSVYRVTALLTEMRREGDSDIHLVITDPTSGGTMIAEFPTFTCTKTAAKAVRGDMRQARKALAAACGGEPGSKPVPLAGTATLTGIGFFDVIHGQTGVAPNGIELHPVLAFESADCRRLGVAPKRPRG